MKLFNLEEAKKGSPICTADGKEVFFVGVRKNGIILVENSGDLFNMLSNELFMKPIKNKVFVVLYKDEYEEYHAEVANISNYLGGKLHVIEVEE